MPAEVMAGGTVELAVMVVTPPEDMPLAM